MKTLAIIGASGHGRVVADAALSSGVWDEVVFYDDAWPDKIHNGPFAIRGNSESLLTLTERPSIIIAIGDNRVRHAKQMKFAASGFFIATVVHPLAVISTRAIIGHGTVVIAGAVINTGARVGEACIVNTNAVIEHDCVLEDAVHVSPGACLAGGVVVGGCSWIGIGASVIQQKIIGKNVIVGANAAVVTDIPDEVTVVGVPAKVL